MFTFLALLQDFQFSWENLTELPDTLWVWLVAWAKENTYVVMLAIWTGIRAMGATVKTGNTGLFFSFGKATRILEPGFVFKIPYFQRVVIMPTRSRTLDVPDQKVTSAEGLVWFVDVNLVYRIIDIRKAVVEVDVLEDGMKQMLGLSVQETVRGAERDGMRMSGGLDEQLEAAMGGRLEAWGVQVESVGFTSIRPSPETLKFTQQRHACEQRSTSLAHMDAAGVPHVHALAMLGTVRIPRRRARRARAREGLARRTRRIQGLKLLGDKITRGTVSASRLSRLRRLRPVGPQKPK